VDIDFPGGALVAALTPDGTWAALAGSDTNAVSLWETRTGRETASIDVGGSALSLAFDSKGLAPFVVVSDTKVASRERPQAVWLQKWGMRGDGSWHREWSRPSEGFTLLVPMVDGVTALVLGRSDSYFAVWDVETGTSN
jgi:WD40 repeat protein